MSIMVQLSAYMEMPVTISMTIPGGVRGGEQPLARASCEQCNAARTPERSQRLNAAATAAHGYVRPLRCPPSNPSLIRAANVARDVGGALVGGSRGGPSANRLMAVVLDGAGLAPVDGAHHHEPEA